MRKRKSKKKKKKKRYLVFTSMPRLKERKQNKTVEKAGEANPASL